LDYRGTHRYALTQRQNGTAALTEPFFVYRASSRRWLVTLVGLAFLVQAIRIAVA
jgi:hypothetical protein